MTASILNIKRAFPAVTRDGSYHPALRMLRNSGYAGVYGIISARTGQVLYVGESHSQGPNALYDTITRHFRAWTSRNVYANGRRFGGVTYKRESVKVACVCIDDGDETARSVQKAQYACIQELEPRDNQIEGTSIVRVTHNPYEEPDGLPI